MKLKTMIGLLLVFTFLSATVIYAEDVTVNTSTFTLPDGYTVNQTSDNMVILTSANNEAIVVYEGGTTSIEEARQNRLDMGFNLAGEKTYDVEGIEINQQNYNKENMSSCVYTFKKNGKDYIITYTLSENQEIPSNEANPVTGIVKSLN